MHINKTSLLRASLTLLILFISCSRIALAQDIEFSYFPTSKPFHKFMAEEHQSGLYEFPFEGAKELLPECKLARESYKVMTKKRFGLKLLLKALRKTVYSTMKHEKTEETHFFRDLVSDHPYTYVIMDDRLLLVQTALDVKTEHTKDLLSKHFLVSRMAKSVRYAGQMWIKENQKTGEIFLILDNGSGTYKPKKENLPLVKQLLEKNLGIKQRLVVNGETETQSKIFIETKNFDQQVDDYKLFQHQENPFVQQTATN